MVAGLNPLAQQNQGITNNNAVQANQIQASEFIQPDDVQSLMGGLINMVKADAMRFDVESMALNKSMVKLEQKLASEDMKGLSKTKEGMLPQMIEALLEVMGADNLDRKKRKGKKTPLETKMEELAGLEKMIDLSILSPEEREEFEKLFDNLSRIKQLQGKLTQLENQEDALEERLLQEKEKLGYPNQDQGQQQKEHPSNDSESDSEEESAPPE